MKTELQSTANLISSVKSVGELVTAEYYGEVISDGKASVFNDSDYYVDLISDFQTDLMDHLDAYMHNQEKRPIYKEHLQTWSEDYAEYQYLLTYVLLQNLSAKEKKSIEKKFSKDKFAKIEKNFVRILNDKISKAGNNNRAKALETFINGGDKQGFELFYKKHRIAETGKEKNKEKIILIGRGCIKAGFDLGSLDESKLIYDRSKKQIRFYDFRAQILDTIINPWFIPELKVPGYVFVNCPKSHDYNKVLEIKKNCLQELAQQASHAGILEQADVYGKEVLKQFFITLTNEPELKVTFEELPHKALLTKITKDKLIDSVEAFKVLKLFNKYESAFLSESGPREESIYNQKRIIAQQLKKCEFYKTKKKFNLFDLAHIRFQNHIRELDKDSLNIVCKEESQIMQFIILLMEIL
ncbi:hypothetical protein [Marinifilum sp.]|uniref:hypothetical protein n=1 Tax=Marinifilum sp. TaxID=2033137 RepID=UPI003BAD2CE0